MTLSEAFAVQSSFVDYTHFELSAEQMRSSADFMAGGIEVPQYEYRHLRMLYQGQTLDEKKLYLRRAIAALRDATAAGGVADMYLKSYQAQLNRILMVEAAHAVLYAADDHIRHKATQRFWRLNRRIYGAYDDRIFAGMMRTESDRLAAFQPESHAAKAVARYLRNFFAAQDLGHAVEPVVFPEKLLGRLQEYVLTTYEDVLDTIPITADDVYYDAEACRKVMQRSLEAAELADLGWRCEILPGKACPSTDSCARRIYLPPETYRNARELCRLMLHEQEVHARRAENGRATQVAVLRTGTATTADAEEGLGVLLECAVMGNANNASFHRARDRYITAGLALGADGHPRNARQTFDILWRLIAVRESERGAVTPAEVDVAKRIAYTHVHNAFRGTNFATAGVIYAKLKIYYEGIRKNAQYFASRSDDLESAFEEVMLGKYNHTNVRERAAVKRLLSLG